MLICLVEWTTLVSRVDTPGWALPPRRRRRRSEVDSLARVMESTHDHLFLFCVHPIFSEYLFALGGLFIAHNSKTAFDLHYRVVGESLTQQMDSITGSSIRMTHQDCDPLL